MRSLGKTKCDNEANLKLCSFQSSFKIINYISSYILGLLDLNSGSFSKNRFVIIAI